MSPERHNTIVNHYVSCVAPAEDLSDSEDVLPKEIAKWNSNDLMDKIEAADTEETPGMMMNLSITLWTVALPQNLMLKMCMCVGRRAVEGNDSGL